MRVLGSPSWAAGGLPPQAIAVLTRPPLPLAPRPQLNKKAAAAEEARDRLQVELAGARASLEQESAAAKAQQAQVAELQALLQAASAGAQEKLSAAEEARESALAELRRQLCAEREAAVAAAVEPLRRQKEELGAQVRGGLAGGWSCSGASSPLN